MELNINKNKPDSLRVLITGGTIDKRYNIINGQLVFRGSLLPKILKRVRCTLDVRMETVLLLDSLYMTEEDCQYILRRALDCDEKRLVITHGTDTMEKTARVLGPAVKGKVVVLVGAMTPYAFGGSDALFNLGCAMTGAQCLPSGVYLTMNSRIFTWDNVTKHRKRGLFVTRNEGRGSSC